MNFGFCFKKLKKIKSDRKNEVFTVSLLSI